ncbi:uncharacterized protein QC761_104720 [Podospora bellae-mahoneyi]|uniref:Rhodopsin domain-containing protein n=1 Tax=Podospora bellae-mahoneyi TaxID=2093777 RepID=A0ABR0FV42_9PEZI|nr:hypothetical protein QC761_104720 [Podospora bellae-mahoneyi]
MSDTFTPPQGLAPEMYESRAGVVIAVVAVCLTTATTAVGLRSYSRATLIRQFGMDDWAAIVALLLAMGSGIMVASNTIYGHGKHIAVVDGSQLWKYFRTFYTSIVLYNGSLTAIKITFLLQYWRILGTPQMRKVVMFAGIIVALWSISQLLVVIFTCTPIERFWLPETPGTCIPNLPFWYINAAGNIVTDVIVFVVPLPALSKLNLKKNQKVALIGIFCLGFFTCAISVIRIQYLRLSEDVTWDNVASSCWSVGELCSGITCACLPTLRPLVAKIFPSMNSSNDSYGSYQKSSGRDGTAPSKSKRSRNETGSTRSIIYPEDVELQSDDRSDKEVRVDRVEDHAQYGDAVGKLKLGLKPSVTTEIKVGTPGPTSSRPVPSSQWGRGIEVKHDLVVTKEGF